MAKHKKYNRSSHTPKNRIEIIREGAPKIVAKKYRVTSQTAYHITELALRENMSEGRIIDKIMRMYLATQKY